MMRYKLFYLIILYLIAGCAVGPDYIRPEFELPAADNASSYIVPFAAADWWKIFCDPTLDRIELEALAHNRDLKFAMARVDEARALARIAFADRLPSLVLGADSARYRSSRAATPAGESRTAESFDAFGICSFELDLWGKYKRLDEAARAELLSTEAARDAVRLFLTADVAYLYFQLRTLQAQTRIARRRLESYDRTYSLYKKRYQLGYTKELDLRRIEADRFATGALLYQSENRLSQAETALSMLLGRNPRDIVKSFSDEGKTLEELYTLPPIPEHIPSDLLARRPDIFQAEGILKAANARIGVARAAYFPSISLTGRYGFVSSDLQDLFTGGANVWTLAGSLAQPVFEGGRLRGQERAVVARRGQMLAQYEKAVQNAFRETRNALVAGKKTAQALDAALARTGAMHRSLELSRTQHTHGYISIIDVLDIERQTLLAELDLAAARQSRLESVIALCKTLGGGWHEKTGFPQFRNNRWQQNYMPTVDKYAE